MLLFTSQHLLEASVCLVVLLLTHMQHHAKVAMYDPGEELALPRDEWEGVVRPSM